MKKITSLLIVLTLGLTFCNSSIAQGTTEEQAPRDRIYDRFSPSEREIIPYDHIRESDVFMEKRIWRVIDSREKINLPFKYEGIDWKDMKPLITIFNDAIKEGSVVYDDEYFKIPLTPEAFLKKTGSIDTIALYDIDGNYTHDTIVTNEFDPNSVKKFRVKEDWFFDKETSTLQVRILGIAPIYTDPDAGELALYWVYYPDFRKILVKQDVFNPKNDAIRFSWDDIFEGRLFGSYIIKESNVLDRKIQDYKQGVDALMEAEKIKQEMFEWEHDLWSL
ncbi:gliding motility protein GldO [Bacteroidota bacterium]|nr:gliding motility protein GldO [Bacteroidota bacterium]